MDTAALAAASDPDSNRQFSRRWTGPPPENRKRLGASPHTPRANFESITAEIDSPAVRSAQRAVAFAEHRAAQLERQVRILADIGQRGAADRLAAIAATLRAVAQ